jgi:hypothetical protein
VCLALVSCQLALKFDRSKITESTDALCSDHIDNDGDGLVDCQDFKCLGQRVCCDVPTVVLADTFDRASCASQACDDTSDPPCRTFDPRWQSWGSPQPILCEGTLSPDKIDQCYDVGLLDTDMIPLRAGLDVKVGVVGIPEIKGRLDIGLTLQDTIEGTLDPCTPIVGFQPIIAAGILADGTGYRVVARWDQGDSGTSPLVTDPARHEVELRVDDAGYMRWSLDGTEFAVSPGPVPTPELSVHVGLAGRGQTARFDDVDVTVGTQCETPAGWARAPEPLPLDTGAAVTDWDAFSVGNPGAVTANGDASVYYTGCTERNGECDPVLVGVGLATGVVGGPLVRADATCPLIAHAGFVCTDGFDSPITAVNEAIALAPYVGIDGSLRGFVGQPQGGVELVPLAATDALHWKAGGSPILAGAAGDWDAQLCCASALEDMNGLHVWYAGRPSPDAPWAIGLAESTDGGMTWTKRGPVLPPGTPGGYDGGGVLSPAVLFDARRNLFKMWYQAQGPFGVASIGYAVSTDGLAWHKFPSNPVVKADDLMLTRIGSPSVADVEGTLYLWLEGASADRRGARVYQLDNKGATFGTK